MTKKLVCPNCEKERLVEPVREERTVNVKGEPYTVTVSLWRCLDCKEEMDDPEQPCDELDLAYREYRAKNKMLQPEHVRELREGLGLTQAELAKLLGWSPATLSRYEGGALQEKSHDNILQSLNEPIYVLGLLNRGENLLLSERLREVKNIIRHKLETKQIEYISCGLELKEPGINSGNISYCFDKYRATVQRIALQLQGVPKTKMNKLLFYSDFLSYKKRTKSITGAQYIHLLYGPCPEDYQSLLGALSDNNFIEIEEVSLANGNTAEIIKVRENIGEDVLTEEEKAIIDDVCSKIGSLDTESLSKKSHEEKGYALTALKEVISYEYAKYLSLD